MVINLKHFGSYFVGSVAAAIAGFLSVPLLIRVLSEGQFARWALLEPILVVSSQVALFGASWGVIKLVGRDRLSAKCVHRAIIKCGWWLIILVGLISGLITGAMGFSVLDSISLAFVVFVEAIVILVLATCRASHYSTAFAAIQIVRSLAFVLILGIATYGLVRIDVAGNVVLARLAVGMVAFLTGAWLISRMREESAEINKKIAEGSEWAIYKEALRYGFPMLITAILTMVLDYTSRYVLAAHLDLVYLAHYVVYTKLVSAMSLLIVTPFSLWWATERFRRLSDADGGLTYFPLIGTAFLLVLLLGAGSLWMVSTPVLNVFAPGVPDNSVVIALLLLGSIFAGMAYPLNIGLLNEGMTHKNIYAVLISALTNVILCVVLIPRYGLIGSASATALGYLVYMLAFSVLSQRCHYIPFAWREMMLISAKAMIGSWLIFQFIPGDSFVDIAIRLMVFWLIIMYLSRSVYCKLIKYHN